MEGHILPFVPDISNAPPRLPGWKSEWVRKREKERKGEKKRWFYQKNNQDMQGEKEKRRQVSFVDIIELVKSKHNLKVY